MRLQGVVSLLRKQVVSLLRKQVVRFDRKEVVSLSGFSSMTWKSDGDDIRRKYDYSYDAANRLMQGDFKQDNGGTSWDNSQMNYNMKMGNGSNPLTAYDANGNIKGMTQYGWKLGGSTSNPIDSLTYSYFTGTNKLMAVSDAYTTNNKLGDFYDKNTGTVDYGYDRNGNMVSDLNKDINGSTGQEVVSGGAITYNYLNLPSVISVAGKGTINYSYDAAGNKLQKTVAETGQPSKTTLYIGGAVYENDVLQFLGHEEGRIRALYNNSTTPTLPTGFAYDYMLKDHLGNVRMLLTEEQKQDIYPAATLENVTYNGGTAIAKENEFYTIDTNHIKPQAEAVNIPVYQNNNGNPPYNNNPYSNYTAYSQRLYQLNATNNTISDKTGLGIVLKVMAGDTVNIFGKSYHKRPTGSGYTDPVYNLAVSDIVNSFAGNSMISSKGVSGSQITGQSGFPTIISNLIGSQPAQSSGQPRAAINWVVFDDQFKYVSGGFDMVGDAGSNTTGTYKVHDNTTIPTIAIPKNGYIYVYCSNESKYNVFFDNLQVIHTRGPILEETHYYPYGLIIAGVSSKALNFGAPENKKKYNGIEYNTDFNINTLDAFYRNFDPQIGRAWQIDPKPSITESPYSMMGNNPIRYEDPLGDTAIARKQDQDKIENDLKTVYKKAFFSFNTNGQLKFTGKGLKALAKYQNYAGNNAKKAAMAESLKGMDKLVNGTEKTAIVYSNDALNFSFTDRSGVKKTGVRPTDNGGELTLTKSDNTGVILSLDDQDVDNVIFINPANSTTTGINPTLMPNVTLEQLKKASLNGGQYPVTFNRHNLLMHGIGHTLYQGVNEQQKVMQFDNANRKLSGDPKNEDLDGTHH